METIRRRFQYGDNEAEASGSDRSKKFWNKLIGDWLKCSDEIFRPGCTESFVTAVRPFRRFVETEYARFPAKVDRVMQPRSRLA